MIRSAALALGFVLVAASDWQLVVEGIPEPICAKSREVCETARAAIRDGKWEMGISRDVATACAPAPGCFSPASECIAGYNCGRTK